LERRGAALCREHGPLRAVLARIAWRLVDLRAWERIGHARLSDYAPLARAWRTGTLSWVKAGALVPLVSADPLGRFVADWVRWAGRVTVRRLRDDVERALAMAETDPGAFRDDGGLPPEARPAGAGERDGAPHREIRARHREVSVRPSADGGEGAGAAGNDPVAETPEAWPAGERREQVRRDAASDRAVGLSGIRHRGAREKAIIAI